MGTQKHDDAPEPQSPERRSPPTVNEIVEELKSLPLNVGYNRLANELFKTGPLPWDADSRERRWRDSDDATALRPPPADHLSPEGEVHAARADHRRRGQRL